MISFIHLFVSPFYFCNVKHVSSTNVEKICGERFYRYYSWNIEYIMSTSSTLRSQPFGSSSATLCISLHVTNNVFDDLLWSSDGFDIFVAYELIVYGSDVVSIVIPFKFDIVEGTNHESLVKDPIL